MATVTFEDHGDGTGGMFTIGETSGADWILYVSRVPAGFRKAGFEAKASGTGDDTADIELASGPYLYVLVADSVPAGPVPFRVSNSEEGTHFQCLSAIRDLVLQLALPLVPRDEARHRLRKVPAFTIRDFGQNPEGVHYWMLPERPVLADNGFERVMYPVQVAFIQGNEKETVPDYRWTLSRQLLRNHSTGKTLPGVDQVDIVTVLPGMLYPEDAFNESLDLQTMVFECQTDETFRI